MPVKVTVLVQPSFASCNRFPRKSPPALTTMSQLRPLPHPSRRGALCRDRFRGQSAHFGRVEGAYPDVPWPAIEAIGNKLRHGYRRIDAEIMWRIAVKSLPELRPVITALLHR